MSGRNILLFIVFTLTNLNVSLSQIDTIISDNKSDCTAELSENGSEENI